MKKALTWDYVVCVAMASLLLGWMLGIWGGLYQWRFGQMIFGW